MKNTGHGFAISGGGIADCRLSGGGLEDTYQLAQFHFHWGVAPTPGAPRRGSEHTVNGRHSPVEIHFVHYKTKFPDLTAAVKSGESDALAVIGLMLESRKSARSMPEDSLAVREVGNV